MVIDKDFGELFARLAAGSAQREREDINPFDEVKEVAASGLLNLRLPARNGLRQETTLTELFEAIIGLAAADPVVAHILRGHFAFIEELRTLPEYERNRWSSVLAEGKILANATSELTGAVGANGYATELVRTDRDYVLNGTKYYSTGTLFSDYIAVPALLREADGNDSIFELVIPVTRDGVVVIDDWDGIGQRRTGSGTTRFESVHISQTDIKSVSDPTATPGKSTRFSFLQLYIHALIAGILERAVCDSINYLRRRSRNFSHGDAVVPIDEAVIQQQIGILSAHANTARALVLDAAQAIQVANAATGAPGWEALVDQAVLRTSHVKIAVDRLALEASSGIFEVGGASAASQAVNLDRHWRNIRTLTLHNPTSYKAVAVGRYLSAGTPFPDNGFF